MGKGVRVQMIIDAPDDLYQLQSPPGLKEAVLHAQSLYEKTQEVRVTSSAGTDLTYRCGEYPVMSQYGMADEPGRFDHWGVGLLHTFPNEGSAHGKVVFAAGRHRHPALLPLRHRPVQLEIREGHITSIEGGVDAALMRDWLAEGKTSERGPRSLRRLARRLGPQPAMPLGLARPLRRRARAQPRRGAQLPRQLPVLHRPEHAGRRQAHHARPLRRADARLHDRARRPRRRRGRPHRRPARCVVARASQR